MSTNYQMYLKSGDDTFRFPVLPVEFKISYGDDDDNIRVCGIGDVTIIQDEAAASMQFESFFPKEYFSGCECKDIPEPADAFKRIRAMKKSRKPVRFIFTNEMDISMYCTITKFEPKDVGGDVGTIHYVLKLKEYRPPIVRQIKVNSGGKVKLAAANSRTDLREEVTTYTVKKGDCLWNIAKKLYGDGSKYMLIYNANKSVIGSNPNIIRTGQVLVIPSLSGNSAQVTEPMTGSRSNPPYDIVSSSYSKVKSGFTSWPDAYDYYLKYGGLGKGWKILDKNKNTVTV